MSESVRMWMEITFNIAYLVVVWGLVIAMFIRRRGVEPENRPVASLVMKAFALLAIGDTGHVGFRVLAYALGDLQASIPLWGFSVGLVGAGALATAVTVTFFYVFVLIMWQRRFKKSYGWFGFLLFGAAIIRLVIMVFPANEWNNLVPPQPWGLFRNIPLMVQGLGAAYLILRDAGSVKNKPFWWIGICILISYALYMPVIFFVQKVPVIGMLMIPKTMAYVAIAVIAFNAFYRGSEFTVMDIHFNVKNQQ
jgi:hypothetical protein